MFKDSIVRLTSIKVSAKLNLYLMYCYRIGEFISPALDTNVIKSLDQPRYVKFPFIRAQHIVNRLKFVVYQVQ